ncbi:MAG: ATP-binding protein [Candidatus Latescibacterota bacterium]
MGTSDPIPEHTLRLGSSESPLEEFTDSYILFRETTRTYRELYEQLQAKFEMLNVQLEETNVELRRILEEKDRVSNYLNNILESLSGGVLVVDPAGEITLFNQAAEQITGRSQEQVLGRPYAEVVGLDAGRQNSVLHTLETGVALSNREKELRRSDGRRMPLGFSTSLVRDEAGRVLGAVEVFNDMTEVKRLEAEVQRAHTLAALGEMAATVAHEIRNPLGGIATFANLLGRQMGADDPGRRLVNKITEGVGRLNRIVTSLLTYTRPLRLSAHDVDFVEMVEEATAFYAIELERTRRDIRIERLYPDDRLVCCIDPEQFQQVILNLLQNATQAMPSGGTLTVQVSAEESLEPRAVLCVRDTGIGMTPDVQQKLFTPFFTTKEDGTGLGLVTSRKIVDAHGGSIRVESQPGQGTSFLVSIPPQNPV